MPLSKLVDPAESEDVDDKSEVNSEDGDSRLLVWICLVSWLRAVEPSDICVTCGLVEDGIGMSHTIDVVSIRLV